LLHHELILESKLVCAIFLLLGWPEFVGVRPVVFIVAVVLRLHVLDQLVLAVILDFALGAGIWSIKVRTEIDLLIFDVATEVIVPVADGCEGLVTSAAFIGLLAGMNAHVNEQIASLVELLLTKHAPEARCERVAAVHYDILALARLFGRTLECVQLDV